MARVVRGPWGQQGRHPLWEALWPELAVLPTPGQGRVIAAVVEEIGGLLRTLEQESIRDHAAWLRGLLRQADPALWPPEDFARVLAVLKAKKGQLITQVRAGQLRTQAQNRRLWVALAAHPHCDEKWLYDYIREHFPHAKRKKGGKFQPSVSMLTRSEVGRIIDHLEGRPTAPRRRRSA